MARLGHEDIKTTLNTYGHRFPSMETALSEALDAHLAAPSVPAVAVVVPFRGREG